MSNEIQTFTNNAINANIRSVVIDGEPWFVAKDVCNALDIRTNNLRVILDDDEIRELAIRANDYNLDIGSNGGSDNISDCSNGGRAPLIVSESGMYKLVFKSRKPEANTFTKWVTKEVLPSIRKTGEYKLKQRIKHLEYFAEERSQCAADAWKEVRKIRQEYCKYQFTYPGKYYTVVDSPWRPAYTEWATVVHDMNELAARMGHGIVLQRDGTYTWHVEVWKKWASQRGRQRVV